MALPLLLTLALFGSRALDEVIVQATPGSMPGSVVADTVLATIRGRFELPNGLNLSLGIDIQTRVDGLLALHTVYASDGSQAGIRVYTDGTHLISAPSATQTIMVGPVTGTPEVIIDRSLPGTIIIPTSASPAATVNIVKGDPSTWPSGADQTQVPLTANGPAVAVASGEISLTTSRTGAVVTLQAPGIRVQQLLGQETGVLVANTANDRVIDTVSSVNVDLHGLSPALLSSTFAASRAVLEAIITR